MTTEDRARFETLLEDLQTSVKVVAEGHLALVERLDRMEARSDARFEQIETRFDARLARMETRFDARFAQLDSRFAQLDARFAQLDSRLGQLEHKVDQVVAKLDVFSIDTRHRLDRIETHLGFDGRPPAAKRAPATGT